MEEHSVITLSWGQKNTPILENRQHLGRTECFSIEGESSSSSSSSSTDLRLHICPGFVTSLCSPAPQGSKKKEREFHSSKEKEVVGLGDSFNSLVCFLSLEGVWTLADCQPGWKVQCFFFIFFTAFIRQVMCHLFQNWWSNEPVNKDFLLLALLRKMKEQKRKDLTERKRRVDVFFCLVYTFSNKK